MHVVFTANVVLFLAFAVWYLSRRYFPADDSQRSDFVLLCLITLAIRVLYVALFVAFFPERVISPDGARYFYEIQQIVWEPWEWNPLTGEGPYYQATAKMGMSYLYGVVLFLYQIDSLYGVLVLNIVYSFFAGVIVFLLTRELSDASVPPLLAMCAVALYPETLFWTARIARENVTLLLVPALLYVSIRAYRTHRSRYLLYIFTILALLLLVRAQLVLIGFLIAAYFMILSLKVNRGYKAALLALSLGAVLYASFALIETQIERAVGASVLQYVTIDFAFWLSQLSTFSANIGGVLTPVARGSYGMVGLAMFPFVLFVGILFLMAVVGFRQVFRGHTTAAGLLLFITISFLGMLAAIGLVNIRFRATVAPLIISVVCVSAYYYWVRLGLPRISLLSSFPGYDPRPRHSWINR